VKCGASRSGAKKQLRNCDPEGKGRGVPSFQGKEGGERSLLSKPTGSQEREGWVDAYTFLIQVRKKRKKR